MAYISCSGVAALLILGIAATGAASTNHRKLQTSYQACCASDGSNSILVINSGKSKCEQTAAKYNTEYVETDNDACAIVFSETCKELVAYFDDDGGSLTDCSSEETSQAVAVVSGASSDGPFSQADLAKLRGSSTKL